MATYRVRSVAHHGDRGAAWLARARAIYLEEMGPAATARRADAIAALPSKDWRGHQVFQLRCRGEFGRGPHDMWVPEALLWSLIHLDRFYCAFHR